MNDVAHLHTCTLCKRRYECWCGQEQPSLYRDCSRCSELRALPGDEFHAHALGVTIP